MIGEIIKNHPMDNDLDTGWIPVFSQYPSITNEQKLINSIQIYWLDVSGILDGEIEIFASSNPDTSSLGSKIQVNTPSNIDDSYLLLVHPSFEYLRFIYRKNNINSGRLYITLSYNQ